MAYFINYRGKWLSLSFDNKTSVIIKRKSNEDKIINIKLYDPFLWIRFNCLIATQPLRGTVYFKRPIIKMDVCKFQFITQQTQSTLRRSFKVMENCHIQIFAITKTLRFNNYIIPPFKPNGLLWKKNAKMSLNICLYVFLSQGFSGHLMSQFISGICRLFSEIIDLTQIIDRA